MGMTNTLDLSKLEMGAVCSDHMLVCDFVGGRWQEPAVVPFGPLTLSPTTLALHYGQTIFEGMKAFRTIDDKVHIFRPDKHYERLVRSSDRMCMPAVSLSLFREGLRQLIGVDREWVPGQEGSALYVRPFVFATDTKLKAGISETYRFVVVCSPMGAYYPQPIRVRVERDFVRAVRGGTGYAKCGGNYGGAFYATRKAREEGYDTVLWTDGIEHRFIEESGVMNVFFVIDGVLVTPPLTDTILDGVTRDSLLALADELGIAVEERAVAVSEVLEGLQDGRVSEAFGAGTAAVVSPIREIGCDGKDYPLPVVGGEGIAMRLKRELDDLRYGRKPDVYGWLDYV